MIEIWIEEAGQEQHRQQLSQGRFRLGRTAENEIYIPNRNVSREHLQIEVTAGRVTVTDLGSTNGAQLNGRALPPHQPIYWPLHSEVTIGPLTLHIREDNNRAPQSQPPQTHFDQSQSGHHASAAISLAGNNLVAHIVSSAAQPQLTTLSAGTIFAGSEASCAIRLMGTDIGPHHCRLTFQANQIEITNLDPHRPVQLDGLPLPIGESRIWSPGQPLQIGSAALYFTLAPATGKGSGRYQPSYGRRYWRYGLLAALLAGFTLFCLVSLLAAIGMQQGQCRRFDLDCLALLFVSEPNISHVPGGSGVATPTAAPTVLVATREPTPTSMPQIIATYATTAGTAAVDCRPGSPTADIASTGWLDLPFPYRGTEPVFGGAAEQFRLISRRSRVGGRINSFFDHEFPVYPARFGGWEPPETEDDMVIFTGQRVQDAYGQDVSDGYWYSGHAGIDFSPVNPREATTPVLAAAAGLLYRAEVDTDGNHMVWLIHDPDGDGFYQYATLYFHLHPDHHFDTMVNLRQTEGQAVIQAGQRIGTMGTTGRSTGIHLHFEVRHRANRSSTFNRLETVDPYGFFATEEMPISPWSETVLLIDSLGNQRTHTPASLDYLWIHPFVAVEGGGEAAGDCPPPPTTAQVIEFEVDIYPVLGFSVVHPGFTFLARDDNRNILDYSLTRFRHEMEIHPGDLTCGIGIGDVGWRFLPPGEGQTWRFFAAPPPRQNLDGSYTFESWIQQTGHYILVAKQNIDCVPPRTTIHLEGEIVADNVYSQSVTVTLQATDAGFPSSSGIAEIVYSLDCGANWQSYSGRPFVVTLDTAHTCGETGEGEQGMVLGPNDFILLASSRDQQDNIEEPPRQVRFTIR